MGEYDFDVVTEKPCRRGAHEQGVHRGERTAASTTVALALLCTVPTLCQSISDIAVPSDPLYSLNLPRFE